MRRELWRRCTILASFAAVFLWVAVAGLGAGQFAALSFCLALGVILLRPPRDDMGPAGGAAGGALSWGGDGGGCGGDGGGGCGG